MLIKLFELATDEKNLENRVNDFIVRTENSNARVVSVEISSNFIMVVYTFLPETTDPI